MLNRKWRSYDSDPSAGFTWMTHDDKSRDAVMDVIQFKVIIEWDPIGSFKSQPGRCRTYLPKDCTQLPARILIGAPPSTDMVDTISDGGTPGYMSRGPTAN